MQLGIIKKVSAEEITKDLPNIVVLKGTDETKEGKPVYELMEDDKAFVQIANNSFIKKSLELYSEAQKYSAMEDKNIYFAFKENSGCYGNIGFYLKKDGKLYDKTKSAYIELSTGQLKRFGALDSITQILPHEMGHVLQRIVASNDENVNQNSVDMHYSNIITEYSTAFSEGFGEHFQVISRMYEENTGIKNAIYRDIDRTNNSIKSMIDGGKRDFVFPLRLDYYREISPLWQSKFESLKRDELGLNGDGKYKNLSYEFSDTEESILFRNMGLSQEKSKIKSLEQSLSTEIVISNFFVNLITTDTVEVEKRYDKVFNVFSKYLNKNDKPQLIQFVSGYIKEYPEERERLLSIFKESTGYEFTEECAPEIWCISNSEHINFIFDQFGGARYPFYMFNINTCEKEDLQRIKGITKSDAESIILYRDKVKGFKSREEFLNINGISNNTIEILNKSTSKDEIERITKSKEQIYMENSLSNIFVANLMHLGFRFMLWFIIFSIIYHLIIIKNNLKDKKRIFKIMAQNFFKLLFYVLAGFIATGVSSNIIVGNKNLNPIIIFIIFSGICEAITLLTIRKDKLKVKNSVVSTLMMLSIIIYSLI
jgi:DNA uptake protein and related DNA-binding proteins